MLGRLFGIGQSVPTVTAQAVAEMLRAGGRRIQLVDVRESDEWRAGHIKGAVHIPLGQIHKRSGELDPQRPIVAVCHSGSRSAQAVRMLSQAGFAEVSNLGGGMIAWSAARLPVTR
jgi:rhodanese-related sulfurtransferase